MLISAEERVRYDRQIILRDIGEGGQEKLRAGSVLVVGAGGLGAPVLSYLVAAGVGRVGLIDDDDVQLSNLHRQILYTTRDIGRSKAECAADRLSALNPEVKLEAHVARFTAANARRLVAQYAVIVNAVDNFPARYLLNDACVLERRTMVDGAVLEMMGVAMTTRGGESTCYRCLFPVSPPPEGTQVCSEAGVLGPIPGVIGAVQALEVLKVLTGAGEPLYDRLLQFDGAALTFHEVAVTRSATCAVCGPRPTITELGGDDV